MTRTSIVKQNNKIIRIVLIAMLILMAPLVAMQFSDEVKWSWFDFAVIGTLLIGAGLMFELITARVNAKYRGVIALVFVAVVILIWAELAVGIFGTPFSGS